VATGKITAEGGKGGVFERLDNLNEFERQPVAQDQLQGGSYFAAVFSGEHIAATEFVIGALFVQLGAGAFDVLVGLLVGNLLAVLSWAWVCAPIAVGTRLTLYWYLRKIAGPVVTCFYNILNALLYCVLAGAMITVSTSAVRIPFGIPDQTQWYPSDLRFVGLTLVVGAVVVILAIWGFKALARFASVCSPWMVMMFIAGGFVALPRLGHIGSFAGFWEIAKQQIWVGPASGQAAIGFWHIVAFAWICNLAMHLGLSDMALFRYARRSSYGFYSAFGMYLGHYLSWICAGIMGAAAAKVLGRPLAQIDSGSIANLALGSMGALTVVIAGWTTANPTLYRAGLALQVVTPGWPRWLVTLAVGLITTIIACFPFVFTKLLAFVAMYGILLVPVGAIVVTEHWIFPRLGLTRYWSSRKGKLVNWPALVSWLLALLLVAVCWGTKAATGLMADGGPWAGLLQQIHQAIPAVPATLDKPVEILHEFFLVIPVWILTSVVYLVLAALAGARQRLPDLPEPGSDIPRVEKTASETPARLPPSPADTRWYYLFGFVAVVTLLLIPLLAFSVFMGYLTPEDFTNPLVYISLVYFVSGILWMRQRERCKTSLQPEKA
jgi:NCS1 family nucleobase:cation symporter-1